MGAWIDQDRPIHRTTADNIAVIKRSAKKVQEELDALAKNEAAERGADSIVRTSKVIEGKQSFDLYRCLK